MAEAPREPLHPAFLKLFGRKVLVVGGGPVALSKIESLCDAGAVITVVAPQIRSELRRPGIIVHERGFEPADLDGVWFVVAAAPPDVNRAVTAAAESRCLFVNAVDDPATATVYAGAVVRRGPVTVAISTGGGAPALAGLLREALESLLPDELPQWADLGAHLRELWKSAGIPLAARRPLLLEALNRLYAARGVPLPDPGVAYRAVLPATGGGPKAKPAVAGAQGRVSLVGAGPGDPGLLTVQAQRRLVEADLVLYDALVAPEMKALAPEARWFFVGKRARRESMPQETINRILVREAGRGHVVVRLKGGDPFIFGRGGEEALALAGAGIPCEIVPGVSSALAAPALAGISLTHRGVSTAITIVAGYAESAYRPALASLEPLSATIVVLMGISARADIAALLVDRGWPGSTPAALLFGASTPAAWTWTGTLDSLGALDIPPAVIAADLPGIIVIGGVVGLGAA